MSHQGGWEIGVWCTPSCTARVTLMRRDRGRQARSCCRRIPDTTSGNVTLDREEGNDARGRECAGVAADRGVLVGVAPLLLRYDPRVPSSSPRHSHPVDPSSARAAVLARMSSDGDSALDLMRFAQGEESGARMDGEVATATSAPTTPATHHAAAAAAAPHPAPHNDAMHAIEREFAALQFTPWVRPQTTCEQGVG